MFAERRSISEAEIMVYEQNERKVCEWENLNDE